MNFKKNINLNSVKKKYDNDGFVIIKSLLSKEDVNFIKNDLNNFISNDAKKLKNRDINYTKDNKVNSIHKTSNWKLINKIQNDNNLQKISKKLLSEPPKNFGAELFAKPAKTGMPSPIHQDNFYWAIDNANGLTFWISLDNSSKKNGGIFYFKKTHKLGLLQHKPSYAPGSSQTIKYYQGMKLFKKYTPDLKPGDCIIHHSLVVHGSQKNLSKNPRTGLTIRYIGKSSKKDKNLQKLYLSELKTQVFSRKK